MPQVSRPLLPPGYAWENTQRHALQWAAHDALSPSRSVEVPTVKITKRFFCHLDQTKCVERSDWMAMLRANHRADAVFVSAWVSMTTLKKTRAMAWKSVHRADLKTVNSQIIKYLTLCKSARWFAQETQVLPSQIRYADFSTSPFGLRSEWLNNIEMPQLVNPEGLLLCNLYSFLCKFGMALQKYIN